MEDSLHCYEGHTPREIREISCLQAAGKTKEQCNEKRRKEYMHGLYLYRGLENKCSYVNSGRSDSTRTDHHQLYSKWKAGDSYFFFFFFGFPTSFSSLADSDAFELANDAKSHGLQAPSDESKL